MLLVRPCAGSEPALARTLASSGAPRTERTVLLRFAVASRDDAAFAVAEDAADALRQAGEDARVVVTGACAPNAKADQLARVLLHESEPFDVVVVADSDVDLAGADLDALVSPLFQERVGATWAAPVEVQPRTLGDHASAGVLAASLHAFALLAALDPGSLVGKLFAIRRDTLAEVGGFQALASVLGEDMELSRRLRARGLHVVRAPLVARSLAQGRSVRNVIARYARWISVIRAQRPALLIGYPLLFASTGPLMALSCAVALLEPSSAWLVPAVLGTRAFVALLAAARSGVKVRPWFLPQALLADVVLTVAFVAALWSRRVRWRGRALQITRNGRLALASADS
jgi:ceramide glucosyltransferase